VKVNDKKGERIMLDHVVKTRFGACHAQKIYGAVDVLPSIAEDSIRLCMKIEEATQRIRDGLQTAEGTISACEKELQDLDDILCARESNIKSETWKVARVKRACRKPPELNKRRKIVETGSTFSGQGGAVKTVEAEIDAWRSVRMIGRALPNETTLEWRFPKRRPETVKMATKVSPVTVETATNERVLRKKATMRWRFATKDLHAVVAGRALQPKWSCDQEGRI
jgi:hypothetical protein